MRTEMDIAGLDERQRLCWLLANRATLMLVGLMWIGMIIVELLGGRRPLFLIAMIPAIALVRWVMYLIYKKKS